MIKITLLLLGLKGYESLKKVLSSGDHISYVDRVIIGKDKNVTYDYSDKIEELCITSGVPYTISNKPDFKTTGPTHLIAIGWRHLLNPNDQQLIIIHDSLLPKYRGFNPLVTALLNGDTQLGVTAIFGDREADTGDIIKQKSVAITYPVKISAAIELVAGLYADLLNEIFTALLNGDLPRIPQDNTLASYSLWRNKEDYFVDWQLDAGYIERFVNAVGFPYEGARTFYNEKLIRIDHVEALENLNIVNRQAGKILSIRNNQPIVICGMGLIKIIAAFYDNGMPVKFDRLRIRLK
jgi:methionyl-tRNA formyltransferase